MARMWENLSVEELKNKIKELQKEQKNCETEYVNEIAKGGKGHGWACQYSKYQSQLRTLSDLLNKKQGEKGENEF